MAITAAMEHMEMGLSPMVGGHRASPARCISSPFLHSLETEGSLPSQPFLNEARDGMSQTFQLEKPA